MNRSSRRLLATLSLVAAVGSLAVAATTLAQDTPLAAQEKQLKDQAIGALTRKDVTTLFTVMDEYRGLEPSGAQIPAGLFFAEADAARGNGDPVRAERAFGDFFRVASPEGATFAEAMRTYGEFRASITATTWAILDTMKPMSASTPATAGAATAGAPLPPPGTSVRIAPYSIGVGTITHGQFAEFASATGHSMPPQGGVGASDCRSASPAAPEAEPAAAPVPSAAMVCVSWSDAMAYVGWLSQSTGVKFRLPSAAEWEHAASRIAPGKSPAPDVPATAESVAPMATEVPDVPTAELEWVSDCAVTSGVDVGPGDASHADGGHCKQRVLVATREAASEAQAPRVTRESRPPDFRARNLRFRLAL